LCFKIAAVPFHFYAPDVYQGTTAGNAGLLAVLPKIAGIVVLVRVVAVTLPDVQTYGWQIAVVLAALTMTLGNLAALWQNNIRRLLAYSSIAHSGYMLIGLATAFALLEAGETRQSGLTSMLFYLAVYVLATAGTFAALAYLSSCERDVNDIDELAGLLKTHPFVAGAICIFMFSLTGIPPLAGFWGKLSLFGGLLQAAWATGGTTQGWLIALAIIGVLNAAASAGYYLRIVSVMCFREPTTELRPAGPREAIAGATVCAVLVLLVGVLPGSLMTYARGAGRAAVTTSQRYQPNAENDNSHPKVVESDGDVAVR
jgi:NADH-quinone oxidoreductase subunit N